MVEDHHMQALGSLGVCSDVEPAKSSRDLWGDLNSCQHGDEKLAFDSFGLGNGFDAWRRVVVLIGPRSEAQRHRI